jgi:hypothetical protein
LFAAASTFKRLQRALAERTGFSGSKSSEDEILGSTPPPELPISTLACRLLVSPADLAVTSITPWVFINLVVAGAAVLALIFTSVLE